MRYALWIVLAFLSGIIAFGVWQYMYVAPVATDRGATNEAKISEKKITQETSDLKIDITYPQFGIDSIDREIQAYVTDIADQFVIDTEGERVTSAKYELFSVYDSVYIGPDIVSARLAISSYMGGAHPNTGIVGMNFDVKSGKRLTTDDALQLVGLSLTEIAGKSGQELASKLGNAFFPEGAEAKPENYETFLVDQNAVTFIFQAYQVGPYSSGLQEVSFKRK